MNIASNGAGLTPEALLALKRRFPAWYEDPVSEVAYHRELWRLREFDAYQYTLSQRPYSGSTDDLRVRVVAGQVTEVRRLHCATLVTAPDGMGAAPVGVGTIDNYFDWIEGELLGAPHLVRAHFHGLHGYPLSFSLEQLGQRSETVRQWA